MVGLPYSGKSSVTAELGKMVEAKVFCEPEEREWAECVHLKDLSGRFGAHTWFRAIRTCQLYQAASLAAEGKTVFVDSYLDKLLYFCLGKPGMEWLLPTEDFYFDIARQMARIDLEHLPLANCLIFFDIDFPSWHQLLSLHPQQMEGELFENNVFCMQGYLKSGVEFLRRTYGTKVITIRNGFENPKGIAEKLSSQFSVPKESSGSQSTPSPVYHKGYQPLQMGSA